METRAGSKIARPEDLVRLYDIILQNYADMKDITSLDKDGDTYQMIDVNTMYYRTKRLVFFWFSCFKFKSLQSIQLMSL